MPWLEFGRYNFDLSAVTLVVRGIEADVEGVTVSLMSGDRFDLAGEEARLFLAAFREFTASRTIRGERVDPPEEGPQVTLPEVVGAGTGPAAGNHRPSKVMG